MSISLAIAPSGRLVLHHDSDEQSVASALPQSLKAFEAAFEQDACAGLLWLANEGHALDLRESLSLQYWKQFTSDYLRRLFHTQDWGQSQQSTVERPNEMELLDWTALAPPMTGLEYLSSELLRKIWMGIDAWVWSCWQGSGQTPNHFLSETFPLWKQVGRVTFHLAENKKDSQAPFAFLATFTNRLSERQAKMQYLPLAKALQQYAGAQNKKALVALLKPVYDAAKLCPWIAELLTNQSIFRPLAWGAGQAHQFLQSIPQMEDCGLTVRIPDWWKRSAPPRPKVQVSIGEKNQSTLGQDGLLQFSARLSLNGEPLSKQEWEALSQSTDGLVLLKGQWVEVDTDKLKQVLTHWEKVEQVVREGGISFAEGMRLLSGMSLQGDVSDGLDDVETPEWSEVVAGKWLKERLAGLNAPPEAALAGLKTRLKAELRPYQLSGVHWLRMMSEMQLGACLADDMGLGKTIQVIAHVLLLRQKKDAAQAPHPVLLIVPASLLANWDAEIARFAPSLNVFVAHPSNQTSDQLKNINLKQIRSHNDVIITTYGQALRLPWLAELTWPLLVLDEAQAIKNPAAKQTRAIKKLKSKHRIALSGTPIENRLGDLWSLFDFLNPGLLGNTQQFKTFVKSLNTDLPDAYAGLRRLVKPYILRRLKTDKHIISDLPEKTEMRAYCYLSKQQALLYEKAVGELADKIENSTGIERKGLVLAYLMRFKQICNHPAQSLSGTDYEAAESGKFQRLSELCEEIASRQEKVLVFTQFKEMTEPLENHLATVFGQSGLVLHGGTAVKKRQKLVEKFQDEAGPAHFILSLKAGGTGLNLTAGSHVIHFDRWWNPAVENQATDRAFRIGQKRNVLVHKFVCRGTVEEKIDTLIEEKQRMAESILSEGTESLLTEMSNDELLDFVSLDLGKAIR